MGKQQLPAAAAAAGCDFLYHVTADGRAIAASDHGRLRSRHLIDLLELLCEAGRSMQVRELRQFMPPASLESSIATLLELGLIECDAKTLC